MRQNLGISAWLPEETADSSQLEKLIDDADWCFEEKMDGMQIIAHRREAGVVTTNRKGEISKAVPVAIKRALEPLPLGSIVAGEYLDRLCAYAPFDLIRFGEIECRRLPYGERRRAIVEMRGALDANVILPIRHAVDPGEKRELLTALRDEFAEGVVLKRLDAPYVEGVSRTILKVKFRKECDVVVRRRPEDTKRSLDMFVFDDRGKRQFVGSVSAYSYYDRLGPGDEAVATVEYLYATPERLLYGPPVILRFRTDKEPRECSSEQLALGKRFRRSA